MNGLKDRVIIITGASSGMGKAMALLFAKEGASLVLNGRDREKGEELMKEVQKIHQRVVFVTGDVGSSDINETLVQKAIEAFGKLDTIIANAGELGLGEVVNLSFDDWHRTMNTNLNALFYLAKYAIPHMQANGFGVILGNASIAAFKSFPNHPAYCASKAGMVALIKQMAAEYGPEIRANAMCPGPIDTPLIWDSAKAFADPEKAVQNAASSTKLKRLGTSEDVAKLALFLIADQSSYITGATVNIDGGITLG